LELGLGVRFGFRGDERSELVARNAATDSVSLSAWMKKLAAFGLGGFTRRKCAAGERETIPSRPAMAKISLMHAMIPSDNKKSKHRRATA